MLFKEINNFEKYLSKNYAHTFAETKIKSFYRIFLPFRAINIWYIKYCQIKKVREEEFNDEYFTFFNLN